MRIWKGQGNLRFANGKKKKSKILISVLVKGRGKVKNTLDFFFFTLLDRGVLSVWVSEVLFAEGRNKPASQGGHQKSLRLSRGEGETIPHPGPFFV